MDDITVAGGLRDIPHHLKHQQATLGKVFTHADQDDPYVAITFDDGPNFYFTPKILDILKKRNVRATFFLVGKFCYGQEELVSRIVKEGHTIGNHGWSHTRGVCDFERLAKWLDNRGWGTPFYRAPWYNWEVMKGQYLGPEPILIGADRDSQDSRGITSEADMIANIMPLYDGSILLFHDGYAIPGDPRKVEEGLKYRASNTLAALDRVIADIRGNGFQPVPLSMMTFDGQGLYV